MPIRGCSDWRKNPSPDPTDPKTNICTMGGGIKVIDIETDVYDDPDPLSPPFNVYDIKPFLKNSKNPDLDRIAEKYNLINSFTTVNGTNFFLEDGLYSQKNPSSISQHPQTIPINDNEIVAPHFCTQIIYKNRGRDFCESIGDTSGTIYLSGPLLQTQSADSNNASLNSTRISNTNTGQFSRSEWSFKQLPGAENTKEKAEKSLTYFAVALLAVVMVAMFVASAGTAAGVDVALAGAADGVAGEGLADGVLTSFTNPVFDSSLIESEETGVTFGSNLSAAASQQITIMQGAASYIPQFFSSIGTFSSSIVTATATADPILAAQAVGGLVSSVLLTENLAYLAIFLSETLPAMLTFGKELASLINTSPNQYWDKIQDSQSKKGCFYDDSGSVKRIQSKSGYCCKGSCAITGGSKAICTRVAYNGDPAVCCLRDMALNSDKIETCFQSDNRQRTCAPKFRDMSNVSCIEAITPFCQGDYMFEEQDDWTDVWSNIELNVNALVTGDPYLSNPKSFYKSTSTANYKLTDPTIVVNKTNICKNAIVRWLFPNQEFKNWNDFKASSQKNKGAIVLNDANPNGLVRVRMLIRHVFDRYLSEGGSIFDTIDSDGITKRNFVNQLKDICTTAPSLCSESIFQICSNYKLRDFKNNPKITEWCGCYLPPEEYTKQYGDLYGSTVECTPFCNSDISIPLVTAKHLNKQCTQSICLMDDFTLDIYKTNFSGDINFNMVCEGCTRYNQFLIFQDVQNYQNNFDNQKINPPTTVYLLTIFTINQFPKLDIVKSKLHLEEYITRYGAYGIDFTKNTISIQSYASTQVKVFTVDIVSKMRDYQNSTTMLKPISDSSTLNLTSVFDASVILNKDTDNPLNDRSKFNYGLGVYTSSYIDCYTQNDTGPYNFTTEFSNSVDFFSLINYHYICPAVLIKIKFNNVTGLMQIYHQGKNKDLNTSITDLTEYCFTFIDITPGSQYSSSIYDLNYLCESPVGQGGEGSSSKGGVDFDTVLVVPLSDILVPSGKSYIYYDDNSNTNKFNLKLDRTKTKYYKKSQVHPDFTKELKQQNLILSLADYKTNTNLFNNNVKNWTFSYSSVVKKYNFIKNKKKSAQPTSGFNYIYNMNVVNTIYPFTGDINKPVNTIDDSEPSNQNYINYQSSLSTCSCKMTNFNFDTNDSFIKSLNLSENCKGDNTCLNSVGEEVSCSSENSDYEFNVRITDQGFNISKINTENITVTNIPEGATPPIFAKSAVIVNGKLTSLKIINGAVGYIENKEYILDFIDSIEFSKSGGQKPVVNFTVTLVDPNTNPNKNPLKNSKPNKNVVGEVITNFLKKRDVKYGILIGSYIFLIFLMIIFFYKV